MGPRSAFVLVPVALAACSPPGAPSPVPGPALSLPAGAHVDVALGRHAVDAFSVRDRESGITARVALLGVRDVAASTRGEVTVYEHALGAGVHVEHHARLDGTEDFVRFPARPPREELRYRLDTRDVAGLRMVKGSHCFPFLCQKNGNVCAPVCGVTGACAPGAHCQSQKCIPDFDAVDAGPEDAGNDAGAVGGKGDAGDTVSGALPDGGGCSCRTTEAAPRASAWLPLAIAALFARRRRRVA